MRICFCFFSPVCSLALSLSRFCIQINFIVIVIVLLLLKLFLLHIFFFFASCSINNVHPFGMALLGRKKFTTFSITLYQLRFFLSWFEKKLAKSTIYTLGKSEKSITNQNALQLRPI